jgi:type I restriction enzyme S subunit
MPRWEEKKLGDVCEFQNGFAFKSNLFKEAGVPVLRISNIQKDLVDTKKIVFADPKDYKQNLSQYEVHKGDLLIAMSGATTGKIGFNETDKVFYLNQRVGKFEPSKHLDKKFLYLYLSTRIEENLAISAGAAQPNLSTEQIKGFAIPLPPIAEQKQIVAVLDEAFAAIDKAKANVEKNLKNAREIFESYVQVIFDNGNWETKTIEQVCDEIFAGGDAPKNNFTLEKNEKYQIPIYANAVKDRGLYGYTDFARVTKPSITISARGSGTGHTEIRFEQYLPIVRLIVLVPNLSLINLEFLKYSIDNLEILRSGSAIPQLTVPMIKEYNLPTPPVEEQNEIVKKLSNLQNQKQKLEAIYQQKLDNLEELKKSILQKAFAGELTSCEAENKLRAASA